MEVYVHLSSDIWPVQLSVDLAPLTPRTTSYLEDSLSYHLAEVLIVETLKLHLTPFGASRNMDTHGGGENRPQRRMCILVSEWHVIPHALLLAASGKLLCQDCLVAAAWACA